MRSPLRVEQIRVSPATVVSQSARRRVAERRLKERWAALGGAPGAETRPGDAGLIEADGRYHRDYANGGLYLVHAEPVYVHGAIGARYRQLGGPTGWLGWPLTDELDFPEGGRVTKFEHGSIYWWPDAGALDLADVVVKYRGLYCFGETDEASAADEPYALFRVVPPPPAQAVQLRTPIYEDVDARESRADSIELYRGPPFGLALAVVMMEHDLSDPDKFKAPIEGGVAAASSGLVAATAMIPGVGVVLAPAAALLLKAVGDDIVGFLNDLVGGEDDHIATVGVTLTPKQMITQARATPRLFAGIEHHVETPLISGDGSSYKLYFDVRAA